MTHKCANARRTDPSPRKEAKEGLVNDRGGEGGRIKGESSAGLAEFGDDEDRRWEGRCAVSEDDNGLARIDTLLAWRYIRGIGTKILTLLILAPAVEAEHAFRRGGRG
jgi:hypothetical protein